MIGIFSNDCVFPEKSKNIFIDIFLFTRNNYLLSQFNAARLILHGILDVICRSQKGDFVNAYALWSLDGSFELEKRKLFAFHGLYLQRYCIGYLQQLAW
jgi:hypothetical protein